MSNATVTVNVRQRVGLLGKAAIKAARLSSILGVRMPVGVLVWAINRSTYVSIGNGPWRRLKLDLSASEFQ